MIAAIVLAAGEGRRFGGGKMQALHQGVPLVHHAIAAAKASQAEAVYVVVGDKETAASVQHLGVHLVDAPERAEGMAASLRAGINALPEHARGALVFLGDMPNVPHTVAQDLVAALHGDIVAATPRYEGRSGHPVLFARETFPALLALKGDVGAKSVLKALGQRVRYIDVDDPGVLFDVDTPEDLA